MNVIDLRSDTVTRPSPEMRRAMAEADVGDDQYGEDPSVNRLQEEVAALLGKEAALFLPTGTMANQVALRTTTRPGDDVIVPAEAHIVWHETGAGAANSGVQFTPLGSRGTFSAGEFEAAVKPRGHLTYPPTTLIVIENTHNRSGGVIFPLADAAAMGARARDLGLASYCDGARLLNAAVASDRSPADLAAPFDLVSLALSKGLGCPAGSLLAGSRDLVNVAIRYRRMLGGAMRQSGILAAAGSYALLHNVTRLADDHAHARLIAERLARGDDALVDPDEVRTNIVVFTLVERRGVPDAASFVERCRERGVLVAAFGPRTVRVVTHLDVDRSACEAAARILAEVADGR